MFLGGKSWPVREADNLTVICEPIVYTVWDLRRLTTLEASTAFYSDRWLYLLFLIYFYETYCIHYTAVFTLRYTESFLFFRVFYYNIKLRT
jgi:hypothetical protein